MYTSAAKTDCPKTGAKQMKNYKTFYANNNEGCVACNADDLPEGGSWIVSDDPQRVMTWLHNLSDDCEYFKVSNRVFIEVHSEFGIQ
jgi:hypothetical protein